MGTRSFIGVMKGDVCRAVYCHWDGYLSGVGADLQSYTTQAAVEELIDGGDMSSVGDYYNERGETGVDPETFASFDEFYKYVQNSWGEYYYIFKDGVWYCGDTYNNTPISGKLVPYAEAVKLTAREEAE